MLNLEAGDGGITLHLKTFPFLKARNILEKIKIFVIHQHTYKYCEFDFLNIFSWVLFLRKHCDLNLIKLCRISVFNSLLSYASFHFHCRMN